MTRLRVTWPVSPKFLSLILGSRHQGWGSVGRGPCGATSWGRQQDMGEQTAGVHHGRFAIQHIGLFAEETRQQQMAGAAYGVDGLERSAFRLKHIRNS